MIGVIIAPIDEQGCTILVGQYRYVLDRFTWELPAGGCRLDQAPLEVAKVELSEETGYRAARWLRLFDGTVSPSSTDGRSQCFVAWDLQAGVPHPEPEEELVQRRVPFADAVSMALSGEISHFGTISLLWGSRRNWGAVNSPTISRSCFVADVGTSNSTPYCRRPIRARRATSLAGSRTTIGLVGAALSP